MAENLTKNSGINTPKTRIGLMKMLKLIESAENLFTTKGFYQTSISDICKAAGTAVGTFYIYFETKTDIYRYMMDSYAEEIKLCLADAIRGCETRYEKEREGIKCFIKYAEQNPTVYDIIWGSLSVDKSLFANYYESFAKSYTKALTKDGEELSLEDVKSTAYMLMGISNFLGLRAIFDKMSDEDINDMIDNTVMPALRSGMFRKSPTESEAEGKR